jgi:hypothetical protein
MANYNAGIVNVGDPGSAASGYHTRHSTFQTVLQT